MKERQKEHEKWKKRLLKICIFSMQPSLGLWINGYIDSHFLLTVFQTGVILFFFVHCTMQRHLHQHFIGCLGQPHFFPILVNDFVTCPTRLLDGNFLPWVPFRRVQECNHILPCPSYKPGHYLINSWRKAISLSCSALSIICHALLMSMTSLPSGGT